MFIDCACSQILISLFKNTNATCKGGAVIFHIWFLILVVVKAIFQPINSSAAQLLLCRMLHRVGALALAACSLACLKQT